MAVLNTRCPGTTRNRRTRAAVALEDNRGEKEQEEGEKVPLYSSKLCPTCCLPQQIIISTGKHSGGEKYEAGNIMRETIKDLLLLSQNLQ